MGTLQTVAITEALSPIISKIFECLMMDMVKNKLISSDLQFSFKSNSSCSHAILALQTGVKHICDNNVKKLP